jgi:hypothetical protein
MDNHTSNQPTKVCTKCGVEKEATPENFYKDKGGKYGVKAYCIDCKKASKPSPEQLEKQRVGSKRWREENPEASREGCRRWRKANLEKKKSADRRNARIWRMNNPERVKENNRSERAKGKVRKWQRENPDKVRAKERKCPTNGMEDCCKSEQLF